MLARLAVRSVSTLTFPWFSGPCPQVTRVPLLPELDKSLSENYQSGFTQVYGHILRSLAEHDLESLQDSFESTLMSKLESDASFIKNKGMRLKVINDEAPITATLFNAKHNIGVPINRAEGRMFTYTMKKVRFSQHVRKEDAQLFIVNAVNDGFIPSITLLSPIVKSEILRIDCLISSPMKLVLLSETDELLQGSQDDKPEEHLLQFEAELTKVAGSGFFSLPKMIPLEELQWVLTDVDRRLDENPYRVAK